MTVLQMPEQKRVTISAKRQFTIPQKYFTALGFDREAICTIKNGTLVIEPVKSEMGGEFAEEILADLIQEGYTGEALLQEFRTRKAKVRPAVEKMLETASLVAEDRAEYATYEDVFSTEEE